MQKILIITPHYPPSNLAAVHRSRLFAKHLPAFGWEPIILTVDEDYYEEALDWNLHKLLPGGQRVEKVKALAVTRPRLIGDIGLRAFFQLRKKALHLVRQQDIRFVYITIPSFYTALLGPYLYRKTGVRYGIDYIDPWVHHFPGSEKTFSRHWWSTKLAAWLEPIAVKKASLITGVAEGYYQGVIERNPALQSTCVFGAMPYGGEEEDHSRVEQMALEPYLFPKKEDVLQLVYAGAFLPKAFRVLEQVFKAIAEERGLFKGVEIHFIGTGKKATDPTAFSIKPVAEKYGLWQTSIFEHPQRIPYLDVLVHLHAAGGVFILGSTEPHYTPSKVYQAVLSKKPVLAVLHKDSTACTVIKEAAAGTLLPFDGESGLPQVAVNFPAVFTAYKESLNGRQSFAIKKEAFEAYSAFAITGRLAGLLNTVA
ncbi:hypothetical protein HRH25_09900 [Flavisolibacter sp. BT320]|nr:hypothetical protein [Flavisolibacter longurius]